MSRLRNVLWWLGFCACAVALQTAVPGLDALVVGLVILLQERDYKNMLWLLPLFVLLQEGMGTRIFGGIIVWYAAVIALFKLGRWLFEVENFIFVFLLSACLGGAYYGVSGLWPAAGSAFQRAGYAGQKSDPGPVRALCLAAFGGRQT